MDNWDEIKTAYQVARLGTVSGAAEVLGVHHATVIRHIDSIEGRLGVKLFQRHARGYTPTEAGNDLLRVAQATDDQFNQLSGRIKGHGADVSGELVVTSLSMLAPQVVPMLTEFQKEHQDVIVRFLMGNRLFRLEYGEAHVAIRAGDAPDQPDNVVQHLFDMQVGAYASQDYVDAFGIPESVDDYPNHRFVHVDDHNSRAPHARWMRERVPDRAITFRCSGEFVTPLAISSGAGIGFLPTHLAARTPGLIEIHAPIPDWVVPFWLVTHVDLHRSSKVQAFSKFLKQRFDEEGA